MENADGAQIAEREAPESRMGTGGEADAGAGGCSNDHLIEVGSDASSGAVRPGRICQL